MPASPFEAVVVEVVLHGSAVLGLAPEPAADLIHFQQHGGRRSQQKISDLSIGCREAMRCPEFWRSICELACTRQLDL